MALNIIAEHAMGFLLNMLSYPSVSGNLLNKTVQVKLQQTHNYSSSVDLEARLIGARLSVSLLYNVFMMYLTVLTRNI